MSPYTTLAMTGLQHARLQQLLYPGDGKEAVAFLLCGRRNGNRQSRLVVQGVHSVSPDLYHNRSIRSVRWSTDGLDDLLEYACRGALSVIKVHSHPNGYDAFSEVDDVADTALMPAIRGWVEADIPHGSAIMLPDGRVFGRFWEPDTGFQFFDCVAVVGDDLYFWQYGQSERKLPGFVASHQQAFGSGTVERLSRLSIAVVGCSGTGSPVIEQLLRLGVGELVLVDDDKMEDRNVNRIYNSTMKDVEAGRSKVQVLADSIRRAGLHTRVVEVQKNLWSRDAVLEVAQCDLVFGCMDTVDGRFLLNLLAAFYNIPYFDLGVRLVAEADGLEKGKIREVCGSVHFIQPDRSSLISRGLISMAKVAAAGLRRRDPAAHIQQLEDGYITGVDERRPAVISVNSYLASLAVNELLARLHPYRELPNQDYAQVEFSLSSMELFLEKEKGSCGIMSKYVGKGDQEPLLNLPELSERVQL